MKDQSDKSPSNASDMDKDIKIDDLTKIKIKHFSTLTENLKEEKEELKFFNDQPLGGSLTMTSLKIG